MKEQLLSTLENSKNYTMAVAEAMPDKLYDTRPVETVWTFRELMHHIAYGIQWWEDNYVKGNKTDWEPPAVKKDKKQVIVYLEQAYASLKDTVCKDKLSEEAVNGFYATIDHTSHHRGQATIHLRCQGIEPPAYNY